MMESNDKFIGLLEQVCALTDAGSIEWRETSDVNRFTALLKSGGIQIEKLYEDNSDPQDSEYFEATLMNAKSRPIQSLSSHEHAPLLRGLFEKARYNARKGRDVLDGLLSEVSGLGSH